MLLVFMILEHGTAIMLEDLDMSLGVNEKQETNEYGV